VAAFKNQIVSKVMKSIFISLVCLMTFGAVAYGDTVNQKQKVIILLGPPGSGKGTQAKELTQKLGIPHISTGDIFRAIIQEDTELAERAKSFMNIGKLVPDELVNEVVVDRLSRPDVAKGYMLDGYPRTLQQAEALEAHLGPNSQVIVINIQVSDETVIKRISGRISCPKCGSVYNKFFSPPKKEGICDKCGTGLVQRPDDRPEVVSERLKVYNNQTAPLIDYYQKKGLLVNINGEQEASVVLAEILKKIN
jgi:adenylate kinase